MVEVEPRSPGVVYERAGEAFHRKHARDAAILAERKAIELEPVGTGRGDIHLSLNQWDEAIADYTKAMETDPKKISPMTSRAHCYMQLKQWDKAIADSTKVIEWYPEKHESPLFSG